MGDITIDTDTPPTFWFDFFHANLLPFYRLQFLAIKAPNISKSLLLTSESDETIQKLISETQFQSIKSRDSLSDIECASSCIEMNLLFHAHMWNGTDSNTFQDKAKMVVNVFSLKNPLKRAEIAFEMDLLYSHSGGPESFNHTPTFRISAVLINDQPPPPPTAAAAVAQPKILTISERAEYGESSDSDGEESGIQDSVNGEDFSLRFEEYGYFEIKILRENADQLLRHLGYENFGQPEIKKIISELGNNLLAQRLCHCDKLIDLRYGGEKGNIEIPRAAVDPVGALGEALGQAEWHTAVDILGCEMERRRAVTEIQKNSEFPELARTLAQTVRFSRFSKTEGNLNGFHSINQLSEFLIGGQNGNDPLLCRFLIEISQIGGFDGEIEEEDPDARTLDLYHSGKKVSLADALSAIGAPSDFGVGQFVKFLSAATGYNLESTEKPVMGVKE